MAVDLSGYVDVAERLRELREVCPDATLQPLDPFNPYRLEVLDGKTYIVYVAACYRTPDDPRPGIGSAWEPYPGKTNFTRDSELQNAETSAWGRAIVAALKADTQRGVASAQEVENRKGEPVDRRPSEDMSGPLTMEQRNKIYQLLDQKVIPEPLAKTPVDGLTKRSASAFITALEKLSPVPRAERTSAPGGARAPVVDTGDGQSVAGSLPSPGAEPRKSTRRAGTKL